jgi:hypothetical protein
MKVLDAENKDNERWRRYVVLRHFADGLSHFQRLQSFCGDQHWARLSSFHSS